MSTPQAKLNWSDLEPDDKDAAEANVAAAGKWLKDAKGTSAKLDWSDLTPDDSSAPRLSGEGKRIQRLQTDLRAANPERLQKQPSEFQQAFKQRRAERQAGSFGGATAQATATPAPTIIQRLGSGVERVGGGMMTGVGRAIAGTGRLLHVKPTRELGEGMARVGEYTTAQGKAHGGGGVIGDVEEAAGGVAPILAVPGGAIGMGVTGGVQAYGGGASLPEAALQGAVTGIGVAGGGALASRVPIKGVPGLIARAGAATAGMEIPQIAATGHVPTAREILPNALLMGGLEAMHGIEPRTKPTLQHERFGEVAKAEDQSGVQTGHIRVEDAAGDTHVIQNPRTTGNRSAAFVKPKEATTESQQYNWSDLQPDVAEPATPVIQQNRPEPQVPVAIDIARERFGGRRREQAQGEAAQPATGFLSSDEYKARRDAGESHEQIYPAKAAQPTIPAAVPEVPSAETTQTEAPAPMPERMPDTTAAPKPVASTLTDWQQARTYKGSDKGNYADYLLGNDRRKGSVTVELDKKNGYRIRNIYVDESLQRQGLATKAYGLLNAESIAQTGKPLRSSEASRSQARPGATTLSADAEGVWRKLVEQDKAIRVGDHYEYKSPVAPETPKVEAGGKPRERNFTQFANEQGKPSDYDVLDHTDLSPSGSVSNRGRKAARDRQATRASQNAQAHQDYETAIRRGEIIDPDGKVTKEKLEAADKKAAESERTSKLANIDSHIRTIENLGPMSHLPNGKLKAGYQRTVDEYNRQKAALAPTEPAPVEPKLTVEGGQGKDAAERSLPKTLEEAELPGGTNRTYKPISNEASLAKADQNIKSKGLDGAAEWVKGEHEPSAEHTATGLKVISELQKAGRYDDAVDVASDLSDKLTLAGQRIQAVQVLNLLSPERSLLVAERMSKKYKTRLDAKVITEKAATSQADDARLKFLEGEVERLTAEVAKSAKDVPIRRRAGPKSLFDIIKQNGGINLGGKGEHDWMRQGERGKMPGLFRTKDGMPWDDAHETLNAYGYNFENAHDLMTALEAEARGNRQYPAVTVESGGDTETVPPQLREAYDLANEHLFEDGRWTNAFDGVTQTAEPSAKDIRAYAEQGRRIGLTDTELSDILHFERQKQSGFNLTDWAERYQEAVKPLSKSTPTQRKPAGLNARLSERARSALSQLQGRPLNLKGISQGAELGAVTIGRPPLEGDAELLAEYGAANLSKSMDDWKADIRKRFGEIPDAQLDTIARRAYDIRSEERVNDLAERMAGSDVKTRRSAGAEIAQSIRDAEKAARQTEQEAAKAERQQVTQAADTAARTARIQEGLRLDAEKEDARQKLADTKREGVEAKRQADKIERERIASEKADAKKAAQWTAPFKAAADAARQAKGDQPMSLDDATAVAADIIAPKTPQQSVARGLTAARFYQDIETQTGVDRKTAKEAFKRAYQRVDDARTAAREVARIRAASTQQTYTIDANGNRVKGPKRTATLTETQLQTVLAQKEAAQRDADRSRQDLASEFQKLQMTTPQRIVHNLVKGSRQVLLSGITTVEKLGAFGAVEQAMRPARDLVGAGLRQIPGVRTAAAQAPREGGGFNPRAQAAGIAKYLRTTIEMFTPGKSEVRDYVKTGHSDIDVKYGKATSLPPEMTEFFGRLHGAMKTPARLAEFETSSRIRLEHAIEQGLDPTDPMVITTAMEGAYMDANRAIMLADNMVSDAAKTVKQRLRQGGHPYAAMGIDFMLPITKVPVNIVAETGRYSPLGGAKSIGELLYHGIRGTLNKLEPDQADRIMRNLKKGTLGTALYAIAYALPNVVQLGGYKKKNEKEEGLSVKSETMKVFGVDIGRQWIHHPVFETMQTMQTIRRLHDKYGYTDASLTAVKQNLEHVPYLEEPSKALEAFGSESAMRNFVGTLIRSRIEPPDLQRAARIQDQPETTTGSKVKQFLGLTPEERATRRYPQSIGETMRMGIPAGSGISSITGSRQDVSSQKPGKPSASPPNPAKQLQRMMRLAKPPSPPR